MGSKPIDILVYSGLELLGDGVMKLPFLGALRRRWPDARIAWLAGKGRTVFAHELGPVVRGLLDEVIEDAGIGSRAAELVGPRPLAGRRFDLVIDTQRRVLTSLILRRVSTACFVSGAADFWLSSKRPKRPYRRPRAMVRQMLDLIEIAGGAPAEPDHRLDLAPVLVEAAASALPGGPSYVGLAPGAGGAAKRWPLEQFVALGRGVAAKGGVPVFLLGPAEAAWRADIAAALPAALFPLQAETIGTEIRASPLYTIAVASRLVAAVANDSGTGHLVAAAGTPLVSLFGPTPPEKFAPAARRLRVVRAQDFGGAAMDAIPLEPVADALSALLVEVTAPEPDAA